MARSFPPSSAPRTPPSAAASERPAEAPPEADDPEFSESSNRSPTEEWTIDAIDRAVDPCARVLAGDRPGLERYLARGGAPDARCDEGWSLLDLAAAHGHGAMVEALLAAGARATRLHPAVAGGRPDVVRALIAAGAPVDARDDAGFTALHQAIGQGDPELVSVLLRAGADASAEIGDTGCVALARRAGDARLVGLLRQRGARR